MFSFGDFILRLGVKGSYIAAIYC